MPRNTSHTVLAFVLVLFALAALVSKKTHAVTPQPVQLCPIASNTFAVPANATDSVRTLNSANVQACVPYSALTADLKVYGGNPKGWQSQSALGIALYQAPTTPPVAPPTPPAQTCPDTFVPMQWTCTSDGKTATCSAPVPQ